MNCPVCSEPVSFSMEHFMVAIEIPYLNILFHMNCYKNNIDILHKIIEVWYNLEKDEDKINKNGTIKSRRKRQGNRRNTIKIS